jgi:hypothetical protein
MSGLEEGRMEGETQAESFENQVNYSHLIKTNLPYFAILCRLNTIRCFVG